MCIDKKKARISVMYRIYGFSVLNASFSLDWDLSLRSVSLQAQLCPAAPQPEGAQLFRKQKLHF